MDVAVALIYIVGGLCWFFVWRALVGYDWLREMPLLRIAFLGNFFVLAANAILAFFSPRPRLRD